MRLSATKGFAGKAGGMLRAGVATAPLLMALAAGPAFAQSQGQTPTQTDDQAAQGPGAPQTTGTPATASSAVGVQQQGQSAQQGDEGNADVVVTGTLFRRTDTETPSPVTVLTQQSLQERGINTVADAVRSISADNSGSVPISFSGGFANGASGVSLRGLTVNSTLVLFDGLRGANYPLADDGQRSFVDLQTIPDSIVDRIEVLKDGASSTYGADAIGGVVNVILKKQITGVSGTVEGGISERGDAAEQRLVLTAGHGDLSTNGYNAYVNVEYQHDDQVLNSQRGFPYNTGNLSGIGGDNLDTGVISGGVVSPGSAISAVVRPATQTTAGNIFSGTAVTGTSYRVLNPAGCVGQGTLTQLNGTNGSVCQQDIYGDYSTIQPEQTRFGVTGHLSANLGNANAYATFTYYQDKVTAIGFPSSVRQTNPINTASIVLPAVLANGTLNPNDPYAASGQAALLYYRFGDIEKSSTTFSRTYRGAAGVAGSFGNGFDYSVDGTAMKVDLDITQRGYLNIAGLTAAIVNGTYNFVDPSQNTAAVRASIAPNVYTTARSELYQVQGTVSKKFFDLPGGPLQVGVGGSVRREILDDPNQNANVTTLGLNAYAASGRHNVYSAYGEISAPVLKPLEIDLSGRYDKYSEGYDHFSPKVGAKFTPIRELALRGTFSKGFRAPTFAEINSGAVIGYTTTKPPAAVIAAHANDAYVQSYSIGYNSTANPNIKPELSTSFTGGAVFQPVSWLSFTVDYYNIKKTRVISGGPSAAQAIAAYYAGTALPAGYSVTLNPVDPDHPTAMQTIAIVNSPYANAAALHTSGLDIQGTATFKFNNGWKFVSTAEATEIFYYKFKSTDADPYENYVGTQAPYVLSSGAGTPRWRANWQNTLGIGPVTLSNTTYFTSGYKSVAEDQNGAGATTCDDALYEATFCRTAHFIDDDLTVSVKANERFTFYVNVLNLLDAKAPINPANYAGLNYNPTWTQSGVIGRYFRAGANFKF